MATEIQLLKKVTKGNRKAFRELYILYKDKVYSTAIGYLQNIEDAEEVTQDVFLTVYNKSETFKGKSKVSTWIYRITVNKSLNYLNKKNRTFTLGFPVKDNHKIEFNHPGIQLENQEKAKYLFYTINQLPENQKTAFILSYIEGLPQKEVSEIMELTLKSCLLYTSDAADD